MKVPSVCVYCGTGCMLYLRVRDGKVIGTLPHEDGPGEGKLCIKGWSVHEFIHHPDRLTRPLIKEGGIFREANWDEAIDKTVGGLAKAKESHGSDSIAILSSAKASNEENYLMQKLARAAVGTNNVDHCARLCHASTVTGLVSSFGSGAMTNSQEDVEESDVIFVIGSNTSEQHPLIARRMIKAVKKGARLIAFIRINPKNTFFSSTKTGPGMRISMRIYSQNTLQHLTRRRETLLSPLKFGGFRSLSLHNQDRVKIYHEPYG